MPPNLLAIGRLALYIPLTLVLMPLQYVGVKFNLDLARTLPVAYHSIVCRIFGIRRVVRGEMSSARPTLFVSNHSSYLDIEILGSLIPASFISRHDVAEWPGFGTLARLQRTVFIERLARRAGEHRSEMATRLDRGDNLILFPEGTSNDGNRTLPFKSALFSIAELECDGRPLTVQPVSIAYTHLDGIPLGREIRPFVAWYGDMDLLPHLWTLIGLGRLTVRIEFHQPVTIGEFNGRKEMADHCQRVVAGGVVAALYGQRPEHAALRTAA
jgi:1-acyl-sn-glycerol-3-phosphate acyltransferase